MAENPEVMAKQAIDAMANASSTIREAIAAALPVAPTQLLTVQAPGTIIMPEYVFFDMLYTFMTAFLC